MGKFRLYDGNQGFYRYERPNLQDYDIAWSAAGATMIYNGNDGPYDPTRSPFRFELTFEDAELHTVEEGPDAGDTVFTDGEITQMRCYDNGGNLLLNATGLSVDLAWAQSAAIEDDLWNLGNAIFAGGHKFIGSNDSSGPNNDWDGDDIQTGSGNDKVKAKGGNDYIKDAGGKDDYDGGGGDGDTISYDVAFWRPDLVEKGIRADLSKGKIVGFDGEVDKVKNIENVRGTYENDRFKGDGENNQFMGLQGKDVCNGKGGFDTVSFRQDINQGGLDGAKVHLANGWARDGFGNRDKLKSIEGAEGTDFADTFIGDKNSNWFRGRDGADEFVFQGNKFGYDIIQDYSDGQGDQINIVNANSMADLNIYQDGSSAMIEFANGTIELRDFNVANLDAGDFIF